MRTAFLFAVPVIALLAALPASAQSQKRDPEIGYVYPAGGRQGTTFKILVGGQNLRGINRVVISGEGVKGSLARYMGRYTRLNGEERRAVWEMVLTAKRNLRLGIEPGTAGPTDEQNPDRPGRPGRQDARREGRQEKAGKAEKGEKAGKDGKAAEEGKPGEKTPKDDLRQITRHPLLGAIDKLTMDELEFVERKFLRTDPREQPNAQIGETALILIEIAPDAAPGMREIRLVTAAGLTNPRVFHVGQFPEHAEQSPADPGPADTAAIELPAILNGQITPSDSDRFSISAVKGSPVAVRVHARALIPFLADAVPGWFQPVVSIHDSNGNEIAFADDFRFDPDPVMLFDPPATGTYKIMIRDSIYRGRDDFVYRIEIGPQPVITAMFPLGGRSGQPAQALVFGFNIAAAALSLDTAGGKGRIRFARLDCDGLTSNPAPYAVDDLPEMIEEEAEGNVAQKVELPVIVNGRISAPGDVDRFVFQGRAGDKVVAEVTARRLLSPLDSIVRILDAQGKTVASNDDMMLKIGHLHPAMGLHTHHADSSLSFTIAADGAYTVEIADVQGKGSPAHAYRLRISAPMPDFELLASPSSVNLEPGRSAVVTVTAVRRDGFDGAVEIRLAGPPEGFTLEGATIPAGKNQVRMTLTAPEKRMREPVRIRLEGVAVIAGSQAVRPITPADDMMQAFLWRHLAPAQEMLAMVVGFAGRGRASVMARGPVELPKGGSAIVRVKTSAVPNPELISLELSDPPAGVTISEVKVLRQLIEFTLSAGAECPAGFADNVIVQVFITRPPDPSKGKRAGGGRASIGVLPAIPIKVTEKTDDGK